MVLPKGYNKRIRRECRRSCRLPQTVKGCGPDAGTGLADPLPVGRAVVEEEEGEEGGGKVMRTQLACEVRMTEQTPNSTPFGRSF